ncbi:MAG: 5'-nucleotidase C-terminal domain-containing protein [bacterium]
MTKATVFATIFLLILFSDVSCLKKREKNEIETVSIVVTSDVHGRFFYRENSGDGSLSQVSSFIKNLESERKVVVLDNGDMMQGSPGNILINNFSSDYDRNPVALMMDYMGYEAASVGNHEIEHGEEFYSNLSKDFSFPWLSSNILDKKSGELYFNPWHIIEVEELKIVVAGSSVVSSMFSIPPKKRRKLHFEVFEKAMDRTLKNLKNNIEYDLMVGLFHIGSEDFVMDYIQNEAVFDVVFLGHDHKVLSKTVKNESGKKTHVLNPGAYAKNAAVFSFDYDGKSISNIKSDIFSLEEYPADPHFDETFAILKKLVEKYEDIKIGYVEGEITAVSALFGDSRYMKLIHDVMLENSDADISLSAPIAFDTKISGKITNRDIFEIYPFHNYLYIVSMYGYEIKNLLDFSVEKWFDSSEEKYFLKIKNSCRKGKNSEIKGSFCLENKFYNFMSASGMKYTVNTKKQLKPDVSIHSVNGKPFSKRKKYKVAIDSYHANDGGKLISKGAGINGKKFSERIVSISDKGIRDMIVRYVSEKKIIKNFHEENWKVKDKNSSLIVKEKKIILKNFSDDSKGRRK